MRGHRNREQERQGGATSTWSAEAHEEGLRRLWKALAGIWMVWWLVGAWQRGDAAALFALDGPGVRLAVGVMLGLGLGALRVAWKRPEVLVGLEWGGWLLVALALGVSGRGGPAEQAFALALLVWILLARSLWIRDGSIRYGVVALLLWAITSLAWWLWVPSFLGGSSAVLWQGALGLAAGLGAWNASFGDAEEGAGPQDERVEPYRMLARLPTQGISRMDIAWHTLLERPCILKRLSRAQQAGEVEEFCREAELVIWIQNPHVVRVFDFGQTQSEFFLTMELLQGVDLHMLLRVQGPLPPRRAVHLMRQICEGLAAVHEQGILHRDLKPSNLFLTVHHNRYDFVKVIDFGIARRQTSHEGEGASRGHRPIPGTPAYMAPERFQGRDGVAADLYSLGVVLFALLAGRLPFRADSPEAYEALHRTQPPPMEWVRQACPSLLPQLADVLVCALAKDPAERFPSAEAMKGALEQCQQLLGVWRQDEAQSAWSHLLAQGVVGQEPWLEVVRELEQTSSHGRGPGIWLPRPSDRSEESVVVPRNVVVPRKEGAPERSSASSDVARGTTRRSPAAAPLVRAESALEEEAHKVPLLVLPAWDDLAPTPEESGESRGSSPPHDDGEDAEPAQ